MKLESKTSGYCPYLEILILVFLTKWKYYGFSVER